MAYEALNASKVRWTSEAPAIYMYFYVDHYRSGNDMKYRLKVETSTVSGASKYGYPILLDLTVNGVCDDTMKRLTVKSDFPVQWTKAQVYESGWFTVSNATASSYPVKFRLYSSNGSLRDQTFTYHMPVDEIVNSAYVSSPSSGTLGEQMIIRIADLNTSTCYCHVWAETDDEYAPYYYITTGLSSSTTTWTPPKELAKYSPNSNTVTVRLTVQTIKNSDGSQVGIRQTECKLTIPSSVAPSVSLTVSDATDYKDTFGSFVQSLSRFRVQATFKGAYKSTMRSYSLTITGMGTYSDMDTTTGVIPTAGSITLKATVTDSRGNTGTASVTVSVTAYTPPHLTAIKVERSDAAGNVQQDGPCGKITFSAEVTSLGGNNTAAYAYCYRLKGSTAWTETDLPELANQLIVTDQICIFTASIDYSYEVAIRITDKFTATLSTVIPMSSAFILGQVTEDGTGMSFGCRATRSNTIEYGIAAMFDADVTGTALGLAGLPLIPAGSDFNYYTSPGAYSGANANFVNCPSSAAGVLVVSYAFGFLSPSALGIRQVYLPADNSAIYIRILTQANGSWTYGEWKQITLTAVAVG